MSGIFNILKSRNVEKYLERLTVVLFPLLLLLFPLVKVNQGIDLKDTAYSLGNYRFFGQVDGLWLRLTFLSNVLGNFLTRLPMGDTMLGMRFYTSLLVSAAALLGYRFFATKMPKWLAFAGELTAIGLCWCPTVILYNYLTYLLLLLGAVFLFRGLAGARPFCLVAAGVFLGINTFVRFPNNGLETVLILAVWYYGYIRKKTLKKVAAETGLCMAGYLSAFLIMLAWVSAVYGGGALGVMIRGVFGMAGSASDYTLGEMVFAILDAYLHGFRWLLYMILCILPGVPFIMIQREKFPVLRKIIYCVCIVFLFYVLGRWGMYNFRYYQKESALQWGAVFLLIGLGAVLWMLFTNKTDSDWKLIGCIVLILMLITPLGSNNHIWPVLNNLFLISPVIFWMIYRFARWGRSCLDAAGRVPLFPVKAMVSAALIAFFIQAMGVGFCYVFMDGEMGEERNHQVEANPVLSGMYTNGLNSETLEEISVFMMENKAEYQDKGLILYGDIPGLSYYLDHPPAIYTSWPDLATNSLSQLQQELKEISAELKSSKEDGKEKRPLVIITPDLAAFYRQDEAAMEWFGTDREACSGDEKLEAILNFVKENSYEEIFANEAFVVYQ